MAVVVREAACNVPWVLPSLDAVLAVHRRPAHAEDTLAAQAETEVSTAIMGTAEAGVSVASVRTPAVSIENNRPAKKQRNRL